VPLSMLTLSDVLLREYVGRGMERGEVWGSCLRHRGVWAYRAAGALGRAMGFDIDVMLVCSGCEAES
jgi:hypothetical protein